MSGLLALLDDVAGIAKVAAASLDDVTGQAMKAGAKAAGAVIDDAAVTPKYLQGLPAARELPMVGRIALGSVRNKLLILLPIALLLSSFAPWAITPLLMLGGAYLCFEGAEKVAHALMAGPAHAPETPEEIMSAEHLEAEKVSGAIKTDFILSAEIMTIALAELPLQDIWTQAIVLAVVAVGITALVYGSVALIVKADDVGLALSGGRVKFLRGFGRGLVRIMPGFLYWLTIVGTAAMIWVGGSIIIHGLAEFGLGEIAHWIEGMAEAAHIYVPVAFVDFSGWAITAFFDGIFGVVFGLLILPVVTKIINPVWSALTGGAGAN
jgi:predicted DNA repair protein MutK